jgi:hypothetical protein
MMMSSSFEEIAREVLKQKQLMDSMLEENRTLRQQLSDLRAGRGIFLEIEGKRFALTVPASHPTDTVVSDNTASSPVASPVQGNTVSPSMPSSMEKVEQPVQPSSALIAEQEVEETASDATQELTPSKPEILAAPRAAAPVTVKLVEKENAPTFLEKVMIDEFAAAATSPLAVWSGPSRQPSTPVSQMPPTPEEIDEKEMAALRQQLIGSFLLE